MAHLRSMRVPALAAVAIITVCLLAWWLLSPMWFAVISLAGSGGIGVAMTLRSPRWTILSLRVEHLVVWILEGLVASVYSVMACLEYNQIAGTDKTPWHILRIAAAVFSGPMVGPVANPGAGQTDQAATVTVILLAVVLASISPFLVVRRPVPAWVAATAWGGYVLACVVWYLGALVSLAVFLS